MYGHTNLIPCSTDPPTHIFFKTEVFYFFYIPASRIQKCNHVHFPHRFFVNDMKRYQHLFLKSQSKPV